MRNRVSTIYRDLGAWGNALKKPAGDEQPARESQAKLFAGVLALDTGGRGASATFPGTGNFNWIQT